MARKMAGVASLGRGRVFQALVGSVVVASACLPNTPFFGHNSHASATSHVPPRQDGTTRVGPGAHP